MKVGGCVKWTEILHVFGPQIVFGGEPPEFLKLDYKIGPVSNHVAKFHGDRPRDLGDYALEKKQSSRYSVRAA